MHKLGSLFSTYKVFLKMLALMIIIIIIPCYKGNKSLIANLIIMKIRFICFSKDEIGGLCVRSYVRLHTRLRDYKSYDYGVIHLATHMKKSLDITLDNLARQHTQKDLYE